MSVNMNKGRLYSLITSSVIILILILTLVFINEPKWISIYDTDYCKHLKNETITVITMRETSDSVVEVVFSDEDLIEEWSSILETIEIKYNWKNTHFMERMNGGQPLLTVQTNRGSYRFAFNQRKDGYLITINKKRYLVKNPDIVRFYDIYKTAVERHGRTPII